MCVVGRRIESKPVSLTKQNRSKQNYSFPANLKYKLRGLIAANNNAYRTIWKKIFGAFLRYKMSKVQSRIYADELCYPNSQFIWTSAN